MGGERKSPAPHTHLPANRDPDCNIFTDEEYCDWEVSNLKKSIDGIEYHVNRLTPLSPRLPYLKETRWQIRATKFVARHHHRGVIPC